VRFGVKYDVHTGSNGATADVELQVSYDVCGQIAGVWSGQLAATSFRELDSGSRPVGSGALRVEAALTPSTSGTLWIQPGILYNLSGAAVGQASVAVSVAVRK
jgi:hypothetical protein